MVERTRGIDIACHLILIAGAIMVCLPIYFAIVVGSHTTAEVLSLPAPWLPGTEFFENMATAWQKGNLGRLFVNSFVVAIGITVGKIAVSLLILGVLIFSKYFYLASINSYYTFYLIHKFGVEVPTAQTHLFVFLFAVAAGSLLGGPIGDRIGRKWVIWASILGVAPFTLLLPHVNLFWTGVLIVIIGLILSSAFSAILVYAQELIPGRVGMISGLFFGFAFGMGGIGASVLGRIADVRGIEYVYGLCAYLPLIGLVAVFLPNLERRAAPSSSARPTSAQARSAER